MDYYLKDHHLNRIKQYLKKNGVSNDDIYKLIDDLDIKKPDVRYILFEDYNFPSLHYGTYSDYYTLTEVIIQYFGGHETEDSVVYDVKEDKFKGVWLPETKAKSEVLKDWGK